MRAILTMLLAAGALGACSPGDTGKRDPAAVAAPEPSQAARETFVNCTWGEVKGAAWSLWSYACGPAQGGERLVASDAEPAFYVEGATPESRRLAVRLFDKPADAGIEAILPAVQALSPESPGAACALEPDPAGRAGLYVFGPTGPVGDAWDADLLSDTVPGMPCGPLGVGPAGDRVFKVVEGHADTVAYVDYGSEIQIFDAATLKAVTADGH
ncbi:MAG: hypothetical protein NW200_01330 [Hyphomonadaceae bacterium]|nr:hypothetical protein [Hyphomonadaceae bacterium]